MAREIVTDISIDGKELPHFVSLSIQQAFNSHHAFELVTHQDSLATESHTLQSTQDYIGKFVNIAFGEKAAEDHFFRGVITEVDYCQTEGNWPQLKIKGCSPTYLLEGGKHYASFLDKTLKNVAQDLCSNLASNDLNLKIKPSNTNPISYLTQYNESHFQYLNRLAVEYGEWFFCDGQNLYFGKPSKLPKVKVTYGNHLHDFQFCLALAPTNTTHYGYDHTQDKLYSSEAPNEIKGADPFTQKAQQVTDKLYRSKVVQPSLIRSNQQSSLEDEGVYQKEAKAARSLKVSAKGDSPKVNLGCLVEINLQHTTASGKSETEKAEFLVTSISHQVSGTGDYTHAFEGISSNSLHIPAQVERPLAHPQLAVVTDNTDPKSMGRVRVQMHWQKSSGETTDWIRVATPDAGSSATVEKNRGFVFIPEVGDQVTVSFHHSDPDQPYVSASLFHGKNGSGGGKGNNVKTIITKSGHSILLDDTKGEENIVIRDKSGNQIKYDTKKKSLFIHSTEDIELSAKNIKITAEENVEVFAKKKIGLACEKDIEVLAEKELHLQSTKDTKVKSTSGGITLEATKDAVLMGQNVTAEGKAKATVSGAQTKVSGKMTQLQGASGKIDIT